MIRVIDTLRALFHTTLKARVACEPSARNHNLTDASLPGRLIKPSTQILCSSQPHALQLVGSQGRLSPSPRAFTHGTAPRLPDRRKTPPNPHTLHNTTSARTQTNPSSSSRSLFNSLETLVNSLPPSLPLSRSLALFLSLSLSSPLSARLDRPLPLRLSSARARQPSSSGSYQHNNCYRSIKAKPPQACTAHHQPARPPARLSACPPLQRPPAPDDGCSEQSRGGVVVSSSSSSSSEHYELL